MRGVHVAAAAIAALVCASFVSAQGLGDVAAREKEKRKAEGSPAAKVYTENDLGASMAPASTLETLPAADATDEAGEGETAAEGEGAEAGAAAATSGEDERARAEEAWRRKLDQARKEEQVYQEVIDKLQLELNDMSGGVYNPGRAAKMAFLEENQQRLAESKEKIATLEAEGRSSGYR